MPRRKRIHIPGFLWHITHRCHKKEHLLKFEKDRKTWRDWLFKAKKRYGLRVITYAVTCNHIHLLAVDSGKDVISKSMQLLSGNTGQAYNILGQIRVKNDSNTRDNAGIEDYVISESQHAYDDCSTPESWGLIGENAVFWDEHSILNDT